jgi:replicative DNA helicase
MESNFIDHTIEIPPSGVRGRKLLIITYYWPPAGGPGVQRWLKFVKYLPDFGVQPIVYVPENPTYPIVDKHLESEISDQAIILKNREGPIGTIPLTFVKENGIIKDR